MKGVKKGAREAEKMGKGPEMRGWPIVGTAIVVAAIYFSLSDQSGKMGGNQVVKGPVCCV